MSWKLVFYLLFFYHGITYIYQLVVHLQNSAFFRLFMILPFLHLLILLPNRSKKKKKKERRRLQTTQGLVGCLKPRDAEFSSSVCSIDSLFYLTNQSLHVCEREREKERGGVNPSSHQFHINGFRLSSILNNKVKGYGIK